MLKTTHPTHPIHRTARTDPFRFAVLPLALLILATLLVPARAQTAKPDPAAARPVPTPIMTPVPQGAEVDLLAAAKESEPVSTGTLALLKKLEAHPEAIKTVHATFTQFKVDDVFNEKITSSGELWYDKPTRFRCDYADPRALIVLAVQDAFYLYTPEIKQVDMVKFESASERNQQLDHLLIAFNFKSAELMQRYVIHSSEDDAALRKELAAAGGDAQAKALFHIVPRSSFADLAPFKDLKVTIDKQRLLPEKIWYMDPTESPVTLQLREIEMDKPLDEKLFDRKRVFPNDVEYVNKRETL